MIIEIAVYICLSFIGASLLLLAIRFVKGPTLADRVIALDFLTTISIGFTALVAILAGTTAFVDVGLILALVAFMGTVGFAYYLNRKTK